ncbi:MAG TPA: alpha/beta hydrolase [Nitrosospira sp.]|nr:alpha/beta hydrolase [Nitrosospira sp.]
MNEHSTQKIFSDGPAGKLETILAEPSSRLPRGIAVIAHPHPLYGGTMNNKVVHTLFKSFLELGFISVKFNFRGVEQSEGELNAGDDASSGEVDDVLAVVETAKSRFADRFSVPPPLLLAGFSFGGAVQAYAAERLQPQIVVMVAPAVQRLNAPPIIHHDVKQSEGAPPRILIVHGDQDDVVPLRSVLEWAAPQELPVVVVPGAEHFFHRRLHILKYIVLDWCRP